MRESDLLRHIQRRSERQTEEFPRVVAVGPGDDAAAVRGGPLTLLTVDHLVEGRHYSPDTPVDLVARKAVARSMSDIAAMGGTPRWVMATGLLSPACPQDRADALFDAMARWARHWDCPLVGGDIAVSARGDVALTVTVGGDPHPVRGPVLRSGACIGDDVYVSGALGGSLDADGDGRHLTFEPRILEASFLCDALGTDLHAMIDLSDGLGRDGARVAAASTCRIQIDLGAVPRAIGVRDWQRAIGDGEDYELLFTVRHGSPVPESCTRTETKFTRVGAVVHGAGALCFAVDEGGAVIDLSNMGWDHAGGAAVEGGAA